ncbi:hypothetical protein D3C72_2082050 [compost metagenome]
MTGTFFSCTGASWRGLSITTAESTWGRGRKAPAGTLVKTDTSAAYWAIRLSEPKSLLPGVAVRRLATSHWTMSRMRSASGSTPARGSFSRRSA